MNELLNAFEKSMQEKFLQMTISSPRKKMGETKIKIRPVLLKGEMCFQEEHYINNQVFHTNLSKEELLIDLEKLSGEFCQFNWKSAQSIYTCFISKKGKVTVKVRKNTECENINCIEEFTHNRKKNYLLPENVPIDFLVELGVMTKEGKVRSPKYDKFRQINRFLEIIEDVAKHLPSDREIKIIDFGCGKSYLTFAIYYYLHKQKNLDIRIIGLDLKKDVIERCNKLRDKLNYEKLTFINGDIAEYNELSDVDMVVTLHACDTATDYAISKAVGWNAKVILSVPCCQHELNKQIKCDILQPVLKYGLIKERMSALITDALRGALLEKSGYNVQILEFIDMEHTPKNILIRAVKNNAIVQHSKDIQYSECVRFLNADLTLEKLLK